MVFQSVDEVIGGAHGFNIQGTGQQSLGTVGVGGEFFVNGVVDFFAGLFAQKLINAEVTLQVKVDPFIDGVAGKFGENLGEGEEFVFVGNALAGDVGFGHTALTHDFPDVVVGCGEELPGILIAVVVGDLFHIGVVVGVDDGKIFDGIKDFDTGAVGNQITVIQKSHFLSSLIC